MESSENKNLQNGKIYFIGNFIDNDIYIGSSWQPVLNKQIPVVPHKTVAEVSKMESL